MAWNCSSFYPPTSLSLLLLLNISPIRRIIFLRILEAQTPFSQTVIIFWATVRLLFCASLAQTAHLVMMYVGARGMAPTASSRATVDSGRNWTGRPRPIQVSLPIKASTGAAPASSAGTAQLTWAAGLCSKDRLNTSYLTSAVSIAWGLRPGLQLLKDVFKLPPWSIEKLGRSRIFFVRIIKAITITKRIPKKKSTVTMDIIDGQFLIQTFFSKSPP